MTLLSKETEQKLRNWWEHGDQKNPCILASATCEDKESVPDTDDLEKYWSDVDFVIEREMKRLERTRWYGQAVPFYYPAFGASSMEAVLGGKLECLDKETNWVYPVCSSIDEALDILLDPDNFYYTRLKEMTRKSVELSGNNHFTGLFPMEGIGDILAGLCGTENFLMDMMSSPGTVKAAMTHIKGLWISVFSEMREILAESSNVGGIGWAGIWTPGTTFPLQEDVSYMISPAMYQEFFLEHVRDLVAVLDYPLYHLDGKDAIRHLDSLLDIPALKAIQWVPGAGHERIDQWYELINRILAGGKSVQVFAQAEEVKDLVKNVGAKGLLITVKDATHEQLLRLTGKYGNQQ